MALCNSCEWYNKNYDELRSEYDDKAEEIKDKRNDHFCVAYDDNMPKKIWYENGNCPFYKKMEK